MLIISKQLNKMRRRILLETGGEEINLTLSSTSVSIGSSSTSGYTYLYNNNVQVTDGSNVNVLRTSGSSYFSASWDSANNRIKIATSSNSSCASRTANFSVSYKGQSVSFTATQSGQSTTFHIYGSGSYAGEYPCINCLIIPYCYIGSTETYPSKSSFSSNQSWCKVVSLSIPNYKVGFELAANTTNSVRWATITWTPSSDCTQKSLNIMQRPYGTGYDGTVDGYNYVTVNGLKWAIQNIGETSSNPSGTKYQWGSGSTQYTSDSATDYYSGTPPIPSSNDTATQVMGGGWRMPTVSEANSLISYFNSGGSIVTIFPTSATNMNTRYYCFVHQTGKYLLFKVNTSITKYNRIWLSDATKYMTVASGQGSSASSITTSASVSSSSTQPKYGWFIRGVHA